MAGLDPDLFLRILSAVLCEICQYMLMCLVANYYK